MLMNAWYIHKVFPSNFIPIVFDKWIEVKAKLHLSLQMNKDKYDEDKIPFLFKTGDFCNKQAAKLMFL